MSLSPGSQLGPYEIEALLGEGGMGAVYRARDSRLHRTVAVKVAADRFSEEPPCNACSSRGAAKTSWKRVSAGTFE